MSIEQRKKLEDEIAQLQRIIETKKNVLQNIERSCSHQWDESYDPLETEIDLGGLVFVPPTYHDRWKRTCNKCGKTEYTTSFENKKFPKFN